VTAEGGTIALGKLLKEAGLVASASEGNRNIDQGGVRIGGDKVTDRKVKITSGMRFIVQVGKRKWARVTVK
ncbi:MAG: RNA-binding S4 domain-containing protein, partial [Sutterellaceae bacterium]|nr:RNA-binding S4 domain-containing protein [Sutterellaceae bacterium]